MAIYSQTFAILSNFVRAAIEAFCLELGDKHTLAGCAANANAIPATSMPFRL
jgi:hypothetical protein